MKARAIRAVVGSRLTRLVFGLCGTRGAEAIAVLPPPPRHSAVLPGRALKKKIN